MKKDESETDKSEIILPIRTSFSWKSSIYPPSDLHIWSSTFSKTMKFEINPDPPPRLMILLIPGNPGLCEFYDRFLNRLYQNLESNQISNQIICVGHLGLSLKYFNQDKRYLRNLQRLFFNTKRCQQFAELDDQIEFHEGFVEMISHTLDPEKTKLILIGHSVGGHIANKEKMTIFWSEEDQDWWIPKPEIDRIIKLLESTTYQNNSEVGVQEEVKKNLKNVPRWERSNNNIPHAFCLEHGERMADKCASWIKTLLSES
ncbi:Hypothetical protein MELLADRAFT_112942 [Melampsora larici-populina 98AG31]|uniref:Uncharacterized protein n=1 Tax=Melampsora larici-populina (strain 98AG31 / pathotype 3-4-7) TaxID=747676 RepID=F4S867_MELLP|nr:Hypothetical protein MELLADRAFT_112942 [Melampsora larici-populina 98AG31]EGF99133.1 Hypothetical protein MELLADRAFT_112942 [Melampsora larici-populina 98AG31]